MVEVLIIVAGCALALTLCRVNIRGRGIWHAHCPHLDMAYHALHRRWWWDAMLGLRAHVAECRVGSPYDPAVRKPIR